jgi:hypothetical protein
MAETPDIPVQFSVSVRLRSNWYDFGRVIAKKKLVSESLSRKIFSLSVYFYSHTAQSPQTVDCQIH